MALSLRSSISCVLLLAACNPGARDGDGDGWPADTDCDDHDRLAHPEGIEECDEIDNDCDGAIDELLTRAFWLDDDLDGFGTAQSELACGARPGLAEEGGDCDDSNPQVHPAAEELCNGIDDDCDGLKLTQSTWYEDADGDGYGDLATGTVGCEESTGLVLDGTDCDDDNALANPSALEQCDNAVDDDCDGVIGDDSDLDGDGYVSVECPAGLDCDDGSAEVHPDRIDECDNGIDDDCDGYDWFCGFDGEHDLSDADGILTAEANGVDAGRLIRTGDMNGDGSDDVLVAAMYMSGGYVVPGPISGTGTFEARGHALTGLPDSQAGRSIGVGDVDGDGLDDVAFGSPRDVSVGQFIVYGPITADIDLHTQADVRLSGNQGKNTGHGSDLADVDGDGIADAIVGAYSENAAAGLVYVEFGPLTGDVDLLTDADVTVEGTVYGSLTGRVVRAGKDMDGDGVGDFGVNSIVDDTGGPWAGGVYIVSGPITISTFDDAPFLVGPEANANAGMGFALGDFDGDGWGDVAASVASPSPGGRT